MNYLVFDTETTGLSNSDEVIQFSGLLLNEQLKLKKLVNFYCYTAIPINPKASSVNRLTPKKLLKYSGGRTFEDYFLNCQDFHQPDLTWIGYNVKFDIGKVNGTLTNNGLPAYDFGSGVVRLGSATEGRHYFDLMNSLAMKNKGIKQKLSVVAESLHYSQQQLDSMYSKFLQLAGHESNLKYHDSLYDSLITWLLLTENKDWCM